MAMAAAVTLASPRLFSLLNIMLLVKSNCERLRKPLSVVLFVVHLSVIDHVSGTCQARAFCGMSPYTLHTSERFAPQNFLVSLSD